MSSFKNYYRRIYQTFGYPLGERTALSPEGIAAAERRLGVRIPAALRDYYLVAGRERRFGACHNRFRAPPQWEIDKQRLVFLEENQAVVLWGVSTRNPNSPDPPVSRGVNDEPITWAPEHRKCSVFLAHMLHCQAVMGGFRFYGRADVPEGFDYRFAENGWTYYGEVRSLMAYSRPNQAVCLEPPMTVLAGAKTKGGLQAIADDLGLAFG